MSGRRIVVIGGGIAGLAAAHRLVERGGVDVVLAEAGDRLGGPLATEHTGGFIVEVGADSILTEKPWALDLCRRIGFAEQLVGTRESERRTSVVQRGRVEPLPEGFLLLAPTDFAALLASPLFSWRGKLRMGLDLVLPRGGASEDESVAAFVRRRLGHEALDRVAEPLLGGIYTGDAERLSLRATMPRFAELEARHRSLIRGLRATASAPAAGARYSLFVAPAAGMGTLVEALAKRLPEGVVRLQAAASNIARVGDQWRLRVGTESLTVDGVVLAVPAPVAATLVSPLDSQLGRLLGSIAYASSATVTLGFRSADARGLAGFGFVVPRSERRALLACTYASRKYPHRAPEGYELVRGFMGGALRPDLLALDDRTLVETVRQELEALVGIRAAPVLTRIHRHVGAMPQYDVGHLERVAAIEERAGALPGFSLAGAAYRGVGIPDCVRSGEAAAERLAG